MLRHAGSSEQDEQTLRAKRDLLSAKPPEQSQVKKMAQVLKYLERYVIVIGEAATSANFQRVDLCISAKGMEQIRLLDKKEDLRVFGNEDRGSINTPIPIYLWGDGDEPSRYLRLAMSDTYAVTLFGIRLRTSPKEPAKPVKQ